MYAARNTDPTTSHEAADYMAESGKQAFQQNLAVLAVKAYPGHTSLEIAQAKRQCRFMLARRLPECEERGLVCRGPARKCAVSGRDVVSGRAGPAVGACRLMSTAKLLKVTTALSDLANERGSAASQRLTEMKAVQRHVDGLVRKLESEALPNPVSQVSGD